MRNLWDREVAFDMRNGGHWLTFVGYVVIGLAAGLAAWMLVDFLPPLRSLAPGSFFKIR